MKKIALALGGGGARGLAHLGVLRVLENEKIPIGLIAGTSMGAIVGATYAQTPNIRQVEEKFRALIASAHFKSSGLYYASEKKVAEGWFEHIASQIRNRIVIHIAARKIAALSEDRLFGALNFLLQDNELQNTVIPFMAVATDLITGEEVVFDRGPIRTAVAASSALPGFLPPISINKHLLVDGAATSPIPIRAAKKSNFAPVIGVDVSSRLPDDPKIENMIDIVLRTYSITAVRYREAIATEADVLIQPNVGRFHWSAFDHVDYFISEGERAAQEQLDAICRAVAKPPRQF